MSSANLAVQDAVEDALDALSPEEITASARVLALSLAHHRAKFGVMPINKAREAAHGPAGREIEQAGRAALEEAVALVKEDGRRLADEIAEAEHHEGAQPPPDEKRQQLRISVNAPIKVGTIDGDKVSRATLRNISWGGAALRCADMPGRVGDRACLLLPAAKGRLIKIEAEILRESKIGDELEYGVRFDSLHPDDEERLIGVLKMLMDEPDHERRRSEIRLVQRLEVEYGDAGEFRATLEDISVSGMMLTVPEPHEIGQSLLVSLSSVDTPFALNLRAKIVHQTVVEEVGFEMYRVGLQFEHPTPLLRERITEIVRELATMRPSESAPPQAGPAREFDDMIESSLQEREQARGDAPPG
ncbi:MAG: PilZ domain-containing protein [Gammaproteobacteria bacterium]